MIGDGRGRGFGLHSALAVRVEAWTLAQRPEGKVVGLLEQQCRFRRAVAAGREPRAQRLSRPRKSQSWAAGFKLAGGPPPGCQWIYVADRESDFYEPLRPCQQQGVDFIIRGCHDRCLAGGGAFAGGVGAGPGAGTNDGGAAGAGGSAGAHGHGGTAPCAGGFGGALASGRLAERPQGCGHVVEVREVDAPDGVKEPLHWILLTSLPCTTLAEAQRIVGRYTARWWIEEYHKALKSGAGVEESQLERGYRLESLMAVLAVVAVRLLSAKLLARSRPRTFEAARSFGPQMLACWRRNSACPRAAGPIATCCRTARLGGFIWAQARRNARLADHLARLAAADVDV